MSRADGVTLVLGGGNALGAYQAGAYAALDARGVRIDRIVGASVGAINGALIAGNAPGDRIDRLERFWRRSRVAALAPNWPFGWDTLRRTLAATYGLAAGRTGVYRPRGDVLWQEMVGEASPGLFDTEALPATLRELVDFERLNSGAVRYCATALGLEDGQDAAFDTAVMRVGADHVRASAALPPAFPPLAIDGRLFVDAGLSANLPIDPVFAEPSATPSLVLAIDLLPLAAPRPGNLGGLAERAQDLIFAAQSRRSLTAWQRVLALSGDAAPVTLVHLQYADQAQEVSGKAFDFSPDTTAQRWATGERDMRHVLDRLDAGELPFGAPGLTIETVARAGA